MSGKDAHKLVLTHFYAGQMLAVLTKHGIFDRDLSFELAEIAMKARSFGYDHALDDIHRRKEND